MHNKAATVLASAIMIAAAYAVYTAWGWPWKAALFPLAMGVPVFFLASAEVIWGLLGKHAARDGGAKDFQMSTDLPEEQMLVRTGIAIGWILGFFAAVLLLGFPIAIPLFVFLYLKIQGREKWLFSAVFTLAVWGIFYGLFDYTLHLPFPDGWIQSWLNLGG